MSSLRSQAESGIATAPTHPLYSVLTSGLAAGIFTIASLVPVSSHSHFLVLLSISLRQSSVTLHSKTSKACERGKRHVTHSNDGAEAWITVAILPNFTPHFTSPTVLPLPQRVYPTQLLRPPFCYRPAAPVRQLHSHESPLWSQEHRAEAHPQRRHLQRRLPLPCCCDCSQRTNTC